MSSPQIIKLTKKSSTLTMLQSLPYTVPCPTNLYGNNYFTFVQSADDSYALPNSIIRYYPSQLPTGINPSLYNNGAAGMIEYNIALVGYDNFTALSSFTDISGQAGGYKYYDQGENWIKGSIAVYSGKICVVATGMYNAGSNSINQPIGNGTGINIGEINNNGFGGSNFIFTADQTTSFPYIGTPRNNWTYIQTMPLYYYDNTISFAVAQIYDFSGGNPPSVPTSNGRADVINSGTNVIDSQILLAPAINSEFNAQGLPNYCLITQIQPSIDGDNVYFSAYYRHPTFTSPIFEIANRNGSISGICSVEFDDPAINTAYNTQFSSPINNYAANFVMTRYGILFFINPSTMIIMDLKREVYCELIFTPVDITAQKILANITNPWPCFQSIQAGQDGAIYMTYGPNNANYSNINQPIATSININLIDLISDPIQYTIPQALIQPIALDCVPCVPLFPPQ